MSWDPVHDSRTAFLACMRALCSPGTPIELPSPPKLSACVELDGAAAILLALLDRGLTLGVSGGEAAGRVADVIAERTGAARTEPAQADWVLVHGPAGDAIARARRGTPLAPEDGATVVIAATGEPVPMSVDGPGLCDPTRVLLPLDIVAAHAFAAANAGPPCGVDLLVVAGNCVIGLPRSVRVGVS